MQLGITVGNAVGLALDCRGEEAEDLEICYRVFETNFAGCILKKNQNAPRPSEHPPVRGENMSSLLGGIKDCKYKTSSWHLNGFPDGNNIGSTV